MKALQVNTFLYFGDKNVSKISGAWKALHISIYVAIAINSFITSMAAGNMFQTFKYNCILFCTDIEFEKEIFPIEAPSFTELQNFTSEADSYNASLSTPEPSKSANDTVLFKNQTHIVTYQAEANVKEVLQAKIDVRKSKFSSNFWCNLVLGVALVTFIFATFCAVLLAMCSKGGQGKNNTLNRPQNMVYPILLSSILLGILNLVASIGVKNGTSAFCSNFQRFTGEESCSVLINHFTIHERQGNFFLPYLVLSHCFNFTVIFFLAQLVVTFLRVIYAVDYQLYALEVDNGEDEHDLEVEDGQIVKERTM